MKDIVIVGGGGFGREVAWLIESLNKEKKEWNLLGFVDDNLEKGNLINGYEVLGTKDFFMGNTDIYYSCAIGNSKLRKDVVNEIEEKYKVKPATLIDPSVKISKADINIGRGCIICAGNIITVNVSIGDFNIINLSCTIGHDVKTNNFVTICPGVNLSGCCKIGEGVEIGTGTKIIQGKSIGESSIIGAGAVVVDTIPSFVTAVGIPAKVIKEIKQ